MKPRPGIEPLTYHHALSPQYQSQTSKNNASSNMQIQLPQRKTQVTLSLPIYPPCIPLHSVFVFLPFF